MYGDVCKKCICKCKVTLYEITGWRGGKHWHLTARRAWGPHLLALEIKVGLENFLTSPVYEAEMLRNKLVFAPALTPGTKELAQAVAAALMQEGDEKCVREAVWLSRHGLTCFGPNLHTALALAEELEHLAAVQLLSL